MRSSAGLKQMPTFPRSVSCVAHRLLSLTVCRCKDYVPDIDAAVACLRRARIPATPAGQAASPMHCERASLHVRQVREAKEASEALYPSLCHSTRQLDRTVLVVQQEVKEFAESEAWEKTISTTTGASWIALRCLQVLDCLMVWVRWALQVSHCLSIRASLSLQASLCPKATFQEAAVLVAGLPPQISFDENTGIIRGCPLMEHVAGCCSPSDIVRPTRPEMYRWNTMRHLYDLSLGSHQQ